MANQKKHPTRVQGFETIHEIKDSFIDQVDPLAGWDEVWSEVFGAEKKKKNASHESGFTVTDLITDKKDVVFDASKHQSSEAKHVEKAHSKAEAAMNYHGDFIRNREINSKQEMREMNQRLQEIMVELQKLVNSSKVLQMEFAGVSVDQAPQQAGEYHLNFFDWLLLTIRAARQKVEDSGAWLATNKKKNGKKGGGYWDMFKKHGTTFGMSNERSVATQTG